MYRIRDAISFSGAPGKQIRKVAAEFLEKDLRMNNNCEHVIHGFNKTLMMSKQSGEMGGEIAKLQSVKLNQNAHFNQLSSIMKQ